MPIIGRPWTGPHILRYLSAVLIDSLGISSAALCVKAFKVSPDTPALRYSDTSILISDPIGSPFLLAFALILLVAFAPTCIAINIATFF